MEVKLQVHNNYIIFLEGCVYSTTLKYQVHVRWGII